MSNTIELTWYGHACFKISAEYYSILIDPYSPGSVPGLKELHAEADAVFCSHGHGDHNGADCVTLSGRAAPENFCVEQLECPHDDKGGSLRGMNYIRKFSFGCFRAVHMGDIGCELTPEILNFIKGCQLMMIPVGGHFTIDGAQAANIVKQANPGIIVPMHYKSDRFGYAVISTEENFTALCPANDCVGSTLTITGNTATGVYVMTPAMAE